MKSVMKLWRLFITGLRQRGNGWCQCGKKQTGGGNWDMKDLETAAGLHCGWIVRKIYDMIFGWAVMTRLGVKPWVWDAALMKFAAEAVGLITQSDLDRPA
jgi:hypothetical protein